MELVRYSVCLTVALYAFFRQKEREKSSRERNRWVGRRRGSCIFTGMAAITRPREIQLSGVVETARRRSKRHFSVAVVSPLFEVYSYSLKHERTDTRACVRAYMCGGCPSPRKRKPWEICTMKIFLLFRRSTRKRHVCPARYVRTPPSTISP